MTDRRTFLYEDFEISYEDTKKGWSMPYSHHHTNYEIYILLSGERLVTIGDITYRVEAGMASLFESNISHRSVGDTDYTGICIHFSKVYLEKYFLPAVVSSYLTCFKAPIIFIPEDYRQKLVDWNAASCCKSPTAYLLLAQILTDLAAFRYQYPLENEISVSENKASGFQRIINYINANYTTLQTVRDIAESCGVSESYVHRAVRRTESLTVKEYINKLRLRHAIHQVEQGGNSLSVISKSCGFQSVSYFYRVFKKYYGMTPTQYFSKKEPHY
jgi:AraC-like DNA-binding protein